MNVSILVLVVAGVLILVYYILIHVPREQLKRYKMKLGEIHDTYRIMNNVLRNTNAERFLIYESRNGNGLPSLSTQLHISVMYEDYTDPFQSVKNSYQKLEADRAMIETLKQVYDSGDVIYFTADMPDGMLKEMYINQGVSWAYIFRIGQGHRAFYFGSIVTSKNESPFQADSGVNTSVIRLAVNELRGKYRRYNETPLKRLARAMYL